MGQRTGLRPADPWAAADQTSTQKINVAGAITVLLPSSRFLLRTVGTQRIEKAA